MQRIVNWRLYLLLKERKYIKDIFLGCQNPCSFESTRCVQHLPSMPFVLGLFFLQVHQTNIPATASAATDPNTAPTTIPMVPKMHHKRQKIFCPWSYHKESAFVLLLWWGNIWNSVRTQFLFLPQFCVSQFITYVETKRLQCVIKYSFRKRWGYRFFSCKVKKNYRIINIEYFSPLHKLLNYNFRSLIHNLVHKIGHSQISPFSAARVGCTDKMKQKKKRKPWL